jgi:hypothetical protein
VAWAVKKKTKTKKKDKKIKEETSRVMKISKRMEEGR